MSADLPIRLQTACLHMRHKMMFCDERHAEFGKVDANPDRHHVFYCTRTQESLGPDNNPVSIGECCPSRACYRPPSA